MADSNITKRALATALKDLMEENPFDKINVSDICEKCSMNRKSFYYHFRDKYDLVNWIFDTEFILAISRQQTDSGWNFMKKLFEYLYSNRDFYRKALKIEGQNSFSDHFQEVLVSVVNEYISENLIIKTNGTERAEEFYGYFIADGIVCAIRRWILEKNCMEPEEFFGLIRSCITGMAAKVYTEMDDK